MTHEFIDMSDEKFDKLTDEQKIKLETEYQQFCREELTWDETLEQDAWDDVYGEEEDILY